MFCKNHIRIFKGPTYVFKVADLDGPDIETRRGQLTPEMQDDGSQIGSCHIYSSIIM